MPCLPWLWWHAGTVWYPRWYCRLGVCTRRSATTHQYQVQWLLDTETSTIHSQRCSGKTLYSCTATKSTWTSTCQLWLQDIWVYLGSRKTILLKCHMRKKAAEFRIFIIKNNKTLTEQLTARRSFHILQTTGRVSSKVTSLTSHVYTMVWKDHMITNIFYRNNGPFT